MTNVNARTPNMVYKGHREITTIAVPYFLLNVFAGFWQKIHMPLLTVPYKGVPYKPYWV